MSAEPSKPLFLRVTPAEMRQLDLLAVQAMRSRANYVATKIAAVLSGTHSEPIAFPEAAPSDNSVILFVRVPLSFKEEAERRAKQAEVPMSRWLRGLILSSS